MPGVVRDHFDEPRGGIRQRKFLAEPPGLDMDSGVPLREPSGSISTLQAIA